MAEPFVEDRHDRNWSTAFHKFWNGFVKDDCGTKLVQLVRRKCVEQEQVVEDIENLAA